MRILVVGGGISGCLAALGAAEAGHEVTILESADDLGGVLRDHILDKGKWYRNCQYMNVDTPWFRMLVELSGFAYDVFPHQYGSWNDLFGQVVTSDDFAQIVVPDHQTSKIAASACVGSVVERLNCYSPTIRNTLLRWAANWGPPESLHHENCNMMQIGRVFMRDDLQGVLLCKRASPVADELYGVPRHLKTPPSPVQLAALPRDGWNNGFDAIRRALNARRVRIYCKAPAIPTKQNGKLVVRSRGELFPSDLVVWCANPNPLIHALGLERLDSPVTRMINVLMDVDGDLPEYPMYWQIFSHNSPVVRLFTYTIEGRARMTVEAFDVTPDHERISIDSLRFARDNKLDIRVRFVSSISERRYVLITQRDKERFAMLEPSASQAGVVTGGWHIYGRDQRFSHIFQKMMAMGGL